MKENSPFEQKPLVNFIFCLMTCGVLVKLSVLAMFRSPGSSLINRISMGIFFFFNLTFNNLMQITRQISSPLSYPDNRFCFWNFHVSFEFSSFFFDFSLGDVSRSKLRPIMDRVGECRFKVRVKVEVKGCSIGDD